jgi:hypothetical protein
VLSFGDDRTRELANNAYIQNVKYLETAIDRSQRRNAFEEGLDRYLEYRQTEQALWSVNEADSFH